jgi:hypothetical protein
MNPKKLPGLRPSPRQRWKLPVGEFIEECYWKRFGGNLWDEEPREPKPGPPNPSRKREDAHAPGAARDASQAQNLICCLMNLADDLQRWPGHDTVDSGVLPQALIRHVWYTLQAVQERLATGWSVMRDPYLDVVYQHQSLIVMLCQQSADKKPVMLFDIQEQRQ